MARKQRRLSLVTTPACPDTLPTPPPAPEQNDYYGWRPTNARDQIPVDPHETWLRYQAASYLGRPATIEEARELFSRIDVHTRKPIQPAPPRRWWHRLLEL